MAEVKNAFIKSKMNKDLDSRLLPSGEYRNAINAQVSRSESSDVGSLENVLGNSLLTTFSDGVEDLSCIGFYADEPSSTIYVFLTDNVEESYTPTGPGSNHFIYKYNTQDSLPPTLLVSGNFLNFSKLYPIYGVNLLEKLLFWTDNRNQPRKINVESAETNDFYTTEDQISVAKYNPYKAINLFKPSELAGLDQNNQAQYESTMKNVSSKFLPNGGSCVTGAAITNATLVDVDQISIQFYPKEPVIGMKVERVNASGDIVPLRLSGVDQDVTVSGYTPAAGAVLAELQLSTSVDIDADTELIFNSNPYYLNEYPGDSELNKDRFIRFSYRFKFADGEYSIIAPFTQVCFIPEQDGYFMTDTEMTAEDNSVTYEGDMEQAYSSTVVNFMRNKVDEISLQIPLPSIGSSLSTEFNVSEIDILYKESDGLAVQVVETIDVSDLSELDSEIYEYVYQSSKPYKTLPSNEITRVYDKIPVKALGQEIISNRVVYSNFQNKHTPPKSLNYNVSATPKAEFNLRNGKGSVSSDVTADTVIPISLEYGNVNVGSIVTSPQAYPSLNVTVLEVSGTPTNSITVSEDVTLLANDFLDFEPAADDSNTTSIVEYPSSSLKTNRNYQVGVVLSDKFGRQSTVVLSNSKLPISVGNETYSGSTLYSPYSVINPKDWLGNSLKMLFNEGIATEGANPVTKEPGVYNGDSSSIDYNPLGWYSYKIVVKQTEQEYYNVYTAGAMLGLPFNYNYTGTGTAPVLEKNTTFTTLQGDNINKVPRDLSEIGPQDKSFRSSVVLYGRVVNNFNSINDDVVSSNSQFYPEKTSYTVSSIETLFDIFQAQEFIVGTDTEPTPITDAANAFSSFYKSESNPLVARITTSQDTEKQFGVENYKIPNAGNYVPISTLAIFETEAVESVLDIFWETSTSGLVSDLNKLVLEDSGGSVGFNTFDTSPFTEAIDVGEEVLQNDFTPVDSFGANVDPNTIVSLTMSVTNGNGTAVNNYFSLIDKSLNDPGFYNIEVTQDYVNNIYYGSVSNVRNFVFTFTLQLDPDGTIPLPPATLINKQVSLANERPVINNGQGGGVSSFDKLVSDQTFGSFTAVNGAVDTDNRNLEIDWVLLPTSPAGNTFFDIDETPGQGGEAEAVIQRPPQSSNLPGGTFSMQLSATDAGGGGLTDTFTININTVLSPTIADCKDIYTRWIPVDPFDPDVISLSCLIHIEGFGQTATNANGWYIFTNFDSSSGYFETLSGNDPSNDVVLDRTDASNVVDSSSNWFFASTKADVIDIYNRSIPGTSNQSTYQNTESAINDISEYTLVAK